MSIGTLLGGVWANEAWGRYWTWLVFISVIMTYFGVNYFLTGLHSYGSGASMQVPNGVYVFTALMALLVTISGLLNQRYRISKRVLPDKRQIQTVDFGDH